MIHFDERPNQDQCCTGHAHDSLENTENNELVSCKEQLAKSEEKYKYLTADFDNFRRNVAKERVQWTNAAQIKIFEDLVGIIDDFSRAVEDFKKQADQLSEAEKARFAGVELVYKNFLKFLSQHSVVEVPTDGSFNPHMHEALMQVAAEGKAPGTIVVVLQKGYMRKDTVIRPAKVSVAQ